MRRVERKLLVYLGKLEFNHIDDIINRYCFDPLEDIVDSLKALTDKGWARIITEDDIQFYQRTVAGGAALHPGDPNDEEIPF